MFNMEIDSNTISHLAELSDFTLSEAESEGLVKDLQGIVAYISQINELDTEGVEPTYQVFEMENVWREDEIIKQDADREQLLALTKKAEDNQIEVPKVL